MTLGPLMIGVGGTELDETDADRLREPAVGGVILFARNYETPEQLGELVASIRRLRSPPLLVAVDQEGGRVQRFREGFYRLPPARWLGAEYERDRDDARRLARTAGWMMAAELRDAGLDFSFAPVADIDHGMSPVIGDRSFHSDPQAVSDLTVAYMLGMRQAGMPGVAKHFPGHGAAPVDSHVGVSEDSRCADDVDADLAPYRRLIANGIHGILMALVRLPQLDREIACLSEYWIRDILRAQLGFAGAVFTDDLEMQGAAPAGDMGDRVQSALRAGCDMALVCNKPEQADIAIERLAGYQNSVSHARLLGMRATPARGHGPWRGSEEWKKAADDLDEAQKRLELDG
jgi:beta-N-acetylhexosaminidase